MKAMGGLMPLIPFLLVVVVAGEDGRAAGLSSLNGAIANPAEVKAYWEATLPNTPIPRAILDISASLQDEQKLAKYFFYNQAQTNDKNDRKLGKYFFYNQAQTNEKDDRKLGKYFFYNQAQANDKDDQKLEKYFFYNQDMNTDGDDRKLRKYFFYNQAQADDENDRKLGKYFFYNQAQANDEDDQKLGKFFFYNQAKANNEDDQKLGKFFFYSQAQANDKDDQKLGKYFFYNQDTNTDGDDRKLRKYFFYSQAQADDENDRKLGKYFFYNQAQANNEDDQKLGKLFFYNQAEANNEDDQKLGKFFFYSQAQANDGVDRKLGKFFFYNQDQTNDGDDRKLGEYFFYSQAHTNDGDDQKTGEEHKHIHSHRHDHVHFPKGATDFFFFEDNMTAGSVLTARILSTRSSPVFLHRDKSKNIPFSSKNFTDILNMFAPVSLTMADDMATTLQLCEHARTIHDEKAGCAASIESFLDLAVSSLGTKNVRALSPGAPVEGVPSVRYTVASATPVMNKSQSVMVCHDMPYPYKVFFCHTSMAIRAYRLSLVKSDAGDHHQPSIDDALAVCHLNTSRWEPDHPFFQIKHVKPGDTTACHFLGRGSVIWVAAAREAAP